MCLGIVNSCIGTIQVLCNAVGGGGACQLSQKKIYEGVWFNVNISITRGWVGVKFPGKKRYVTLECPHKQSSATSKKIKYRMSERLVLGNECGQ